MSEAVELLLLKKGSAPVTLTDNDWAAVVRAAWMVMQDRQGKRSDVWRRSGARGMAFSIYAKAERVFENIMGRRLDQQEAVEELLDIINYSIFCYMQVASENRDGDWPWPD